MLSSRCRRTPFCEVAPRIPRPTLARSRTTWTRPSLLATTALFFTTLLSHSLIWSASANLLHPLTIHLAENVAECFYEQLVAGDVMEVTFEVETGDKFLIKAEVYGPNGGLIYSEISDAAKTHVNATRPGEHKLCFMNTESDDDKLVSFNMVKNPEEAERKLEESGAVTVYTSLEQSLVNLHGRIEAITELMDEYALRVKRHFYLAESLASRVTNCALARFAVLILSTAAQVCSIKRLFQQPSHAAYTSLRNKY